MRPIRVASFIVLVVLVLPMVFITGIYATHPRDEKRFLATIENSKYGEEWTAFVQSQNSTFFLHEGDRACAWLRDQPFGLMRNESQYKVSSLLDRYLAVTAGWPDEWEVGDSEDVARRLVAISGWQHLCNATLIVHSPHHPFGVTEND